MIQIESYISELITLLQSEFSEQLLYVGLQGSYLRGEATESSDVDIMVVLEELSPLDLARYRNIIKNLPHYDLSCGFICSRRDLAAWNSLEICNLLHSTKDYFGNLADLVKAYNKDDVRNYVKISLNNLYHEICHRYIHGSREKNEQALPFSYKSVFFILQNLHFLRQGVFIGTKAELLAQLTAKDHAVLQRSMELNRGIPHDFDGSFELLFDWCQETLQTL